MKTVAFVPIKLNSQRLKDKNILPIDGKPLCSYIANTLLASKGIDEVYVFASDERVCEYMPNDIIFKKRDPYLDGDLVKGFEIYKAFIEMVDADVYVLAHATSPFIKSDTISDAVSRVREGDYDSAFSATKVQTFSWYKNEPINYDLNDVPRTQDIEPVWVETSAFYIFKKEIFTKHNRRIGFKPYIAEVSGLEAIDIDEKADYDMACMMYEAGNKV